MRRWLVSVVLLLGLFLGTWGRSLATEFTVGTLGFKDYDGYYYFLDLENLTQTYLGVAADFEQIQISFSLDDGYGDYQNRYVITLARANEENVYDDLTDLWFSSYDSVTNTYYDGEDISALPSGESLSNLVADPYNSALLQDPFLFIKDLALSFTFSLSNFTYTENGVDYVFSGTVSYHGAFLDDNRWHLNLFLGLASWSQPITVDIQGTPLGGTQPVPEPATLALVGLGLIGVFWPKSRLRRG